MSAVVKHGVHPRDELSPCFIFSFTNRIYRASLVLRLVHRHVNEKALLCDTLRGCIQAFSDACVDSIHNVLYIAVDII